MGIRAFGAAAWAVGVLLGGTAQAAVDPAVTDLQQKIDAKLGEPCDLPAWRAMVDDPQFIKLSGRTRSLALGNLAYCGDPDAKSILRRATSEDSAAPGVWRIRFSVAARSGDREEALLTMEDAATRNLATAFSTTSDETMFSFSRRLKDDAVSERRFLVALDKLMWAPPSPFVTADGYWIRLTDIYLAEGRVDDARRVWQKAATPYAIAEFRLVDRYAPLRDRKFRVLDTVEAAKQRLAYDQRFLTQTPRNGVGLSAVSHDLRLLGRTDEALKLLDDALAKPGPLMDGRLDARAWVLNERSSVLYDLGRFDEAAQTLREASVLPEHGGANVSQIINLAILLNELGRPQEALDTLDILKIADFTNPFGRMFVEANRACANHALGKDADAAQNLAFTAAHAKDNSGARLQALLCFGDLDAVAAIYVERLADPAQSPGTLIDLSQFAHVARSPIAIEVDRRMDLIRGRADVQAAIAKVGHTETFDLIGSAMENTGY